MKESLYKEIIDTEAEHWWFVARRKIIKSFLKKNLSQRVEEALDIGSGTGGNFPVLKLFSNNLTGTEPNDEVINHSRRQFPDVPVIKGSFPRVDIKNKFDLISLFDVLEHIQEEKQALDKISEILEKDGSVIITVPAYMFLWSMHDDVSHHKRRYTKRSLSKALLDSGFKIDNISYYNTFLFFPIVVVRLLSKFFAKEEKTDLSKTPNILNGIFKFIFGLEAYILPYITFPFGVSIICLASKE